MGYYKTIINTSIMLVYTNDSKIVYYKLFALTLKLNLICLQFNKYKKKP